MSETLVTYELEGDIAIVGIDRPAKRNAVNIAVMEQMHAAFERAAGEARVGVLFGHGGNFSAGLDLTEAAARMSGGAPFKPWERGRWTVPLELVARGPIPWIAAIQGACIGGGLEIAAACQIRVADETGFFALPEAKRGIFVGGGGAVRIQRLIGYARMSDMMLTGRVLSAAEGERANLCQYVVPAGEALSKAKDLALSIASNAPTTNWAICAALPRIAEMGHGDGLFFEGLIGGASRGATDTSRIAAFIERGENKVVAPDEITRED
ncbi:crotonase/enoyl-CoA hydratase family protein [Sphingomonas sp. So64.6b]|uniref:crotonase/enoyl-CoA hydratase family protein n=1 Tax=Sphingomonas sp. So64.6b TaxID=2997354 RepID=UPI0015FF78B9|nr:crotonase/enoyl-CoA hydratase family protein [Sphingomonas sp. So64.6b]QNA86545.1 crotonase/enoyl-CoA hydratase family protein [Sphingomonas sp. So64.6b]